MVKEVCDIQKTGRFSLVRENSSKMKNVSTFCELSDLVSVGPVLVDGVVLVFPGVREVGAPGDQPRLNQLILLERPPTDDCRG